MEKTMQLQIQIDMERLADLLCSAFEGGIRDWGRIEGYRDPSAPIDLSAFDSVLSHTVYPHIHYPLSPDGAVIVRDLEANKTYTLNWEAIQKGLVTFSSKCPRHFADWLAENDDAITGDAFVQCCLFGEHVYG